jgi:hypothetical protein
MDSFFFKTAEQEANCRREEEEEEEEEEEASRFAEALQSARADCKILNDALSILQAVYNITYTGATTPGSSNTRCNLTRQIKTHADGTYFKYLWQRWSERWSERCLL